MDAIGNLVGDDGVDDMVTSDVDEEDDLGDGGDDDMVTSADAEEEEEQLALKIWPSCPSNRFSTADWRYRSALRLAAGLSAAQLPHDRVKCPDCERFYHRIGALQQHQREKHLEGGRKYACKLCVGAAWATYQPLVKHERAVHGKVLTQPPSRGAPPKPGTSRNVPCNWCSLKVTSRGVWRVHVVGKHPEHAVEALPMECEECGQRFIDQYGLTLHKRTHK